ncbi:PH domain-containing protein [Nocardioides sp. GY 10113]|uniref:PH domain-containing protein n=1 Tax=Nocardioides sp. GY 10113 TaxID=2569761 RepID=UPI0010A7B563|nr:PH domain-containing protein [Nocardioides sp. GY 10113]TIC80395.1 PH domain-containing protein [Nocardioides sp. GY 10113]TIC82444.1 PH domain-containing protein [Nocardioides sp. GY 10113]
MPPASEGGAIELPRTWRPFGPRIAAVVFGTVLVAAFVWLWLSFDQQTKDAINVLERATVIGIVLTGVALLFAMARSRVTADEDGLTVVNGYRRRHFDWAQVVLVRMPQGAPWPTLDLDDGSTISMLGIHGSDGARARTAVRELKAVVAQQSA